MSTESQQDPGATFTLVKPEATVLGRISTYTLPDGSVLAIPPAPGDGYLDTEAAVDAAIAIVMDFAKESQSIEGDARLTPRGKAEKRDPLAQKALKGVSDQWSKVQRFADDLQGRIISFYIPPSALDAVTKLDDIETCRWFRCLSPEDRTRFLPQFIAGKWLAVATSLKRSPLPWFEDTDLIKKAWQASRNSAAPELRAELELEGESVDWARHALFRIAERLCKVAGLSEAQVYQALKIIGVDPGSSGFIRAMPSMPVPTQVAAAAA
jgi:hypothetical protein